MLLALELQILFFAKRDIICNPANRQSLAGKPAALGVTGAARAPDVAELMKRQRLDVIGSTPAEFAARLKTGVAKWAAVVKTAGIKAD